VKIKSIILLCAIFIFLFFFFIGSSLPEKEFIQTNQGDFTGSRINEILSVGESLDYEVSYSFIKLGTIKIQALDKFVQNGRNIYKMKSYIDSYNIPLVSLHNVFESEIDDELFSHQFIGSELIDNDWRYSKYDFNYPLNKVFLEKGYASKNSIIWKDTIDLKGKKFLDGLGLFYYARGMLLSKKTQYIPVLIADKVETASIKYPCEKDDVSIDAVNYSVDVLKFEGRADFVGIFGLTGKFTGWFSNDNARIPIAAKMHVILGSVYIELKSWTRQGWSPPKKY
jgi:hypothetical protein